MVLDICSHNILSAAAVGGFSFAFLLASFVGNNNGSKISCLQRGFWTPVVDIVMSFNRYLTLSASVQTALLLAHLL